MVLTGVCCVCLLLLHRFDSIRSRWNLRDVFLLSESFCNPCNGNAGSSVWAWPSLVALCLCTVSVPFVSSSPQPPSFITMGKESVKKQSKPAAGSKREKRPRPEEVVSREYTVNMHKRVHGMSDQQRAEEQQQ